MKNLTIRDLKYGILQMKTLTSIFFILSEIQPIRSLERRYMILRSAWFDSWFTNYILQETDRRYKTIYMILNMWRDTVIMSYSWEIRKSSVSKLPPGQKLPIECVNCLWMIQTWRHFYQLFPIHFRLDYNTYMLMVAGGDGYNQSHLDFTNKMQ